jgi:curved DNA-binding protein CbpA
VNDEVIKYYELLGVAPGASAEELKAAHRDLAKVWHPDRFSHDPRLQQKAQEKLKEINEAYDQLKAGKTGRRTQSYSAASQPSTPTQARPRRAGMRWGFVLLPALAFALIFFAAFRAFVPSAQPSAPSQAARTDKAQALPGEEAQQADVSTRASASESPRGKRVDQQPSKEAQADNELGGVMETRQVRPLPTVTLTIDPASGLLATPDCPLKSRMTYPSGAEPHTYCNLSHKSDAPAQTDPARPKESRLKTFARRLSPAKLFGSKGSSDDGGSSSSKQGANPANDSGRQH